MRRRGNPILGPGEISASARIFSITVARSLDLAAIRAALDLGVFDRLNGKPRSVEGLARDLHCPPDSLNRLLRPLVNLGLVVERSSKNFASTALGELLRSDSAGSLRDFARFALHPLRARALEKLSTGIRTGRPAVEAFHGKTEWEVMADDRAFALVFQRAMSSLTALVGQALLNAYSFDDTECLADIGGGHGELVGALLKALPGRRGILFDLPYAANGARRHLRALGLGPRCRVVSGSFFDRVPDGADLYLLKSVIHNWSDADAQRILINVREAMGPRGRLLILESLLPETRGPSPVYEMDLNMLAFPGGRERTATEYDRLLKRSGLRRIRFVDLGDLRWAIEARAGRAPPRAA